jgi:murein DD-endopeptidase MepM/ murein hydrolase activator NlpD
VDGDGHLSQSSSYNAGVDIAAPIGTTVKASRAGQVVFAGVKGGYGNLVILRHANGLETRYGHLDSFRVKKGMIVPPSQALGTVGSTGRSTGAHLHFEVRLAGRPIDPAKCFVPYGHGIPNSKK